MPVTQPLSLRQAADVQAWHVLPVETVVDMQQTNLERGLTSAEAARRLAQYGPNTLAQAHQRSTVAIFLAQFQLLLSITMTLSTYAAAPS